MPKNVKKRPTGVPPVSPPLPPLSRPQEFYIKGNMEVLSSQQIADDLGVVVQVVDAHINALAQQLRTPSRTNKLFQRPAPGVVAMTEAASMMADDMRGTRMVTQAEINQAASLGHYEEAADLARQREEQRVDAVTQQQLKYSHCVHFIRGPGFQPPVDGAPPRR